jgi:hypothetical protein
MNRMNLTGIQFPDSTWESDFESLAFTVEALDVHVEREDPELARLAKRAMAVLADWEKIDLQGRACRRAVLNSKARVRGADVALDIAIGSFATDLLAHIKNDRSNALYTRFFPEPHEDAIDLGVDAEVPAATLVLIALDHDETLPNVLRKHHKPLRVAVQMGTGALQSRAEALAELGRHVARVEAWKESADAMRRTLARSLAQIAEKRRLPTRWVQAFSPETP